MRIESWVMPGFIIQAAYACHVGYRDIAIRAPLRIESLKTQRMNGKLPLFLYQFLFWIDGVFL